MKWLLFLSSVIFADQFHYNNVLIGDRAAGLGGAFCAISDDASGIVYNPAGLAFALSNDISGSANAFYKKITTYKKAFKYGDLVETDFVEESGGSFSPFVGAIAKVDHLSQGMVMGFGIFTPDSNLKDQDDLIEATDGSTSIRYHRTANARANTTKFGVAAAKRHGSSFAWGVSLAGGTVDELAQVYQDFVIATPSVTGYQLTNTREQLKMEVIEIGTGIQLAFLERFSWGLSFKVPMIYSQSYESNTEFTPINISGERTARQTKIDKPFKSLPTEVRTGLAMFVSPQLLFTTDIMLHTSSTVDDRLKNTHERVQTLDYAAGVEAYVTPSIPVRVGYFTNNDAREDPDSSKASGREAIDYQGVTLYVAMVQPNSQISLGTQVQQGTGKAQKRGTTDIQDIEALAYSFGFSVSHNF